MGLEEKCWERINEWAEKLVTSDNFSAVDVGHLRVGQRPFNVVSPKSNGESSEVLREGADDLSVRAEEFDTVKACINADHVDKNVLGRPWWMQIGTLLAKQFIKKLTEVDGKSCTIITET